MLTWLHLSDLHFKASRDWRDSASRDRLLDFLRNEFNRGVPKPDLIFCTGDLAFGAVKGDSLEAQYKHAKTFFDSLLGVCGGEEGNFDKTRLFIVPGNHDVDRSCVDEWSQAGVWEIADSGDEAKFLDLNQKIENEAKEITSATERLAGFRKFVTDYLPHVTLSKSVSCFASTISVKERVIGIAGFNSAWSCSGDEDKDRLLLGAEWQSKYMSRQLPKCAVRIALMHHPIDWVNSHEQGIMKRQLSSDFDFCLHGHLHDQWVVPSDACTVISAGAIGADLDGEFGCNITHLNVESGEAVTHLFKKAKSQDYWCIEPIPPHAPRGEWNFLKKRISESQSLAPIRSNFENNSGEMSISRIQVDGEGLRSRVLAKLSDNLKQALRLFANSPGEFIEPNIAQKPETAKDANDEPFLTADAVLKVRENILLIAPPQFGLTSLSRWLILNAYEKLDEEWGYLDAKRVKSNKNSIEEALQIYCKGVEVDLSRIATIVVDGLRPNDRSHLKLVGDLIELYPKVRLICTQVSDQIAFNENPLAGLLKVACPLYLWTLTRTHIRKTVAAYKAKQSLDDEDSVLNSIARDLDTLNLPRTFLNCMTLLRVSELDFDPQITNRTEIIRRVLSLIFSHDELPSYKNKPDLIDCEAVLGYFCEQLWRTNCYEFGRNEFLLRTQEFCSSQLLDLDVSLLFDILARSRIIDCTGGVFYFRFTYWFCYFIAKRMLHDADFAKFVFLNGEILEHPEIIEFYTGIDRRRDDALRNIADRLKRTNEKIQSAHRLFDVQGAYIKFRWQASPEFISHMEQEVNDGLNTSPATSLEKDSRADQSYDRSKSYDQSYRRGAPDDSLRSLFQLVRAGSTALRNSDYADLELKRELLREITSAWAVFSNILFNVAPRLATDENARFDNIRFVLNPVFGSTKEERLTKLFLSIPSIVASWGAEELYSQRLGPLISDGLKSSTENELTRHQLMLLVILQRPKGWFEKVRGYIGNNKKDAFYLLDIWLALKAEYRFGYVSKVDLDSLSFLIKSIALKHQTGENNPGQKSIQKAGKGLEKFLPDRMVD